MLIPEKLIRYAAVTPQVYKQGEDLRRQQAVSLHECVTDSRHCHALAGVTDPTEGELLCSVDLNEEGSRLHFNGHCPCQDYKRYTHFCKHLTALLLTVKQLQQTNPAPQFDLVGSLIEQYDRLPADEATADITLTPTLHLAGDDAYVTFTLGRDRQHRLRDLPAFASALRSSATLAYGTSLTFTACAEAFAPDDRPWLALLTPAARAAAFGPAASLQRLPLTADNTDLFFETLGGRPLTVSRSGLTTTAHRSPDAPPLRVVARIRDNRASLSLSDRDFHLLYGRRAAYLWQGDLLYTVPLSYARALSVLLPFFDKASSLSVSADNLPRLAETVLPKLYAAGLLQCEGDGWASWRPPVCQPKLYFEADGHDLALTVSFAYNDNSVNPLRPPETQLPYRDRAVERALLQLLSAAGFRADGAVFRLRGDAALYDFFTHQLALLRHAGAELFLAEAVQRMTPRKPTVPRLNIGLEGGLLSLEFQGPADDIDFNALLAQVRNGQRYTRLPDGALLSLGDPAFANLAALLDGLGLRALPAKRHATVDSHRAFFLDSFTSQLPLHKSAAFQQSLTALRHYKQAELAAPDDLNGQLRHYQLDGFRWLSALADCHFGGILADEMGLGKTIQMIALLLQRSRGAISLVVAPTSLIYNWQYELSTFAPALNPVLVTGAAAGRRERLTQLQPGDVVITSYDTLKRDIACYADLNFACCIADEAQFIKNAGTQNAQAIKKIKATHRFALTGTPIENAPHELWSIFDFLMPGYLYSAAAFARLFERPLLKARDSSAADTLRRLVSPFLLRRLKRDVLTELPPKIETVEHAPLNDAQRKLYNAFLASARGSFLAETQQVGLPKMQIKLLAILTRLRQICCHPGLFVPDYTGGSGKFDLFLQLLDDCRSGGHRVLVFSQFTKMLDLMETRLHGNGFVTHRLDGSTPAHQRQNSVNLFNSGVGDAFLIALKAGGSGLNLTGADTVIHYDPWWNAAVQNQATDRTHRIGQTKPVQVLNLITNGSVEEKIMQLQATKTQLTDKLLDNDGLPFHKLDMQDIIELLAER